MNSEEADLSGCDLRASSQEGVDMPLLDPAGRRTNVTLRVRGTDSEAYQDMLKAQVRRRVDRGARKATEEENNTEFWELHAALVVSWTPARITFDKGGQPLECNAANVARVLERHQWVFEQVRRFADVRANFLTGSSSS